MQAPREIGGVGGGVPVVVEVHDRRRARGAGQVESVDDHPVARARREDREARWDGPTPRVTATEHEAPRDAAGHHHQDGQHVEDEEELSREAQGRKGGQGGQVRTFAHPAARRNPCMARASCVRGARVAPRNPPRQRPLEPLLLLPARVFPVLGSLVDLLHALFMAAWVLGLPLLFVHRYPRATRWYAIYAVVFIVLNQVSRIVLGECFLTTFSRWLWDHGGAPPGAAPGEWFTVRVAMAIFHMAPSHRAITVVSEILILVSAVGMLLAMRRHPRGRVFSRRA